MRRTCLFAAMAIAAGCSSQPAVGPAPDEGDGGAGGASHTPAGRGGAGQPAAGGAAAGGAGEGGAAAGEGGAPAADAAAPGVDAAPPGSDASAPPADAAATPPGLTKIFDGSSWDNWEYDPKA